jgi:hypothetical protein
VNLFILQILSRDPFAPFFLNGILFLLKETATSVHLNFSVQKSVYLPQWEPRNDFSNKLWASLVSRISKRRNIRKKKNENLMSWRAESYTNACICNTCYLVVKKRRIVFECLCVFPY